MKPSTVLKSAISLALFGGIAILAGCHNQESVVDTATKQNAEAVEAVAPAPSEYPEHVYFGDTHLHTSNSFDVYLFGTTASTPDNAYRFAKGMKVDSPTTGKPMQLSRPLDFLVVADHAELMGSIGRVFANDPELVATKTGGAIKQFGGKQTEDELLKIYHLLAAVGSGVAGTSGLTREDAYHDLHGGERRRATWNQVIDAAEKNNDPGKFTALIGWEWSSQPGGGNLHRVVITPKGREVASQFLPFSQLESEDPEKLWSWLDTVNQKTGADFVAIPHNSNVSYGKMFANQRLNGEPITAEYAKTRARWEPVAETTQIKGDSEAHPALSPEDEFADFETYNFVMLPSGPRSKPDEADYVRSGLKRGLEIQSNVGVNPYKYGMIGSTDAHTGMSAVEETHFGGKGQHDSSPELRKNPTGLGSAKGWDMASAGYAGVWATENTRQGIVDAIKRKEVYATTGPRITVRFFGGYGFTGKDLKRADFAKYGYRNGVPMGGDLVAAPDGKAPVFMVAVMKDAMGANLDRAQIVKGWTDEHGKAHERVFDVAVADGRKIGADGRCRTAVGNTVDLKTGKYSNSIGDAELRTAWRDPDFDPSQRAFYYVRAMEIPTPRYSLLDAIALGIPVEQTGHPATIQERIYSSPIWYSPN